MTFSTQVVIAKPIMNSDVFCYINGTSVFCCEKNIFKISILSNLLGNFTKE